MADMQVAANTMGIRLLRELMSESSLRLVQRYMRHRTFVEPS